MSVSAGLLSEARRPNALFELEALEGMPCGCVAAAYRARPWDVAVVSVEAKGHYCHLTGHVQGQILRIGDVAELESEVCEFDAEEEDSGYRP